MCGRGEYLDLSSKGQTILVFMTEISRICSAYSSQYFILSLDKRIIPFIIIVLSKIQGSNSSGIKHSSLIPGVFVLISLLFWGAPGH